MEVRLLGPLEVRHDGRPLALGRPRERAVLTLLLLTPNRVVSAERLVEELWAGRPPDGAVRALRVFVSRLRRVLREADLDGILQTRAPGYLVQVDPESIDVVRFEAGVAQARAAVAAGDQITAAAGFVAALRLWRGPALADVAGAPVARAEAARLEEVRLGALEERIDADLACGRHAELVAELESLTRAHPLRERLWGSRMRALYRCGRQAEALRAYSDLRAILGEELGLDPGVELARLEHSILRHDSGLDWSAPGRAADPPTRPHDPGDELSRPAVRTPYVGRAAERGELGRLLTAALAHRGSLALIGGEAGVGKTRLTQELAREAAARGIRTRVGRCYEAEGAPPYVPFVELLELTLAESPSPADFRDLLGDEAPEIARLLPRLRRLWADLPPPLELPAEQERRYLFNSVRDVLARDCATAPLVLVLEDLHWADEPTLLLLEHLTAGLEELPIVVIGTYRDDEVRPVLARTMDRLIRQGPLKRIAVHRLPQVDIGALLGALAGRRPPDHLIDLIHAQTDGNPFFVEEVYKHLAEEGRLFDAAGQFRAVSAGELDVPETLRLVLGRRLEHLDGDTRRALESAAVMGRAFTFQVLDSMGDLPSDALLRALGDAERTRLVVPLSHDARDPRLLFAHELIRQTILAALPRSRRQRLHLLAAEALEGLSGDEARASEIAEHLAQSGPAADRATLRRYLTLAGRDAMSAAAFEDALTHFESALALEPQPDAAHVVELIVDVALARRSLGRLQDASEAWTTAIESYETLGDHEGMARACSEAAEDLLMCNRDQEGFDLARRGLAALGDAATPLRARILGWAANMGGWIAPYEVAEGLSREAISLANALGDGRLVGRALINEASFRFAYYQLGPSAAAGARAAELLGESGDLWNMTGAQATSAISLVELGRFAEARALCAQVQDLGPRLGQITALFCLDWVQSLLTVSAADLERFEADAVKALELFHGMNFESLLLPRLGSAAFLRGDWDTAVDLTEQGTRHELPNRFHGVAFGPLMQIRGYRGERAAALEVLDQQRVNLPRSGQPNGYGSWQFLGCAIEGLAILGEHARCAELYPMAREFAATEVALTAPTGRLTQRVAGIAAMAAQDWGAAEAHFAAALRLADELPHRLEAAETARFYAHMLLDRGATGDRSKASALLCDAQTRYAEIGMPRHLGLVRDLLVRI